MSFHVDHPRFYSTSHRQFYGPVPANTQKYEYASLQGNFRVSRLPQSNVLDVIRKDPVERGHLMGPYDVSLAETLTPVWQSVGMMTSPSGQIGTCALISANMAIVTCHCIEGLDVRKVSVIFGYAEQDGTEYAIESVLEYDPVLDYAIVKIAGAPGQTHGYLPLDPAAEVHSAPALLHHPLGRPLQVSVHTFVQSEYHSQCLQTFHDSDYGSSGGAYITPSGIFAALHLGSSRDMFSFNLERVALPLSEIFARHPRGLLNRFAQHQLRQDTAYEETGDAVYYLYPYARDFIDLEAFDHARLMGDHSYLVRGPTDEAPGLVIEHYQAKHTPNWPGVFKGKRGSSFQGLSLDDTVLLAEVLGSDIPTLRDLTPANPKPSKIDWPIDKRVLPKPLYKKLQGLASIGIYAAFNSQSHCWEVHFFPQ